MSGNETVVLGPGGPGEPERDGARDQAFAELVDRLNAGRAIDAGEVRARWPAHAEELLDRLREFEGLGMSASGGGGAGAAGAASGAERTFGGYRILREVGRGGMGVVYEAIDGSLDRRVALKVLPPGLLLDERSVTRFQREARIAGKLRHPNVVQVHASGVHEKTPFIAMEFVEGESLDMVLGGRRPGEPEPARGWASKLRQSFAEAFTRATPRPERAAHARQAPGAAAAGRDGPPSPIPASPADMDLTYAIRMANLFAAVAEGLQHAHAAGVLHRDLKPSNLILDPQGNLRILDFGLARSEGQESLTASREIVGTPRYMSPEVARGFKNAVDHRTDIFSLGATLYEVLTLAPAFPGGTAQDTLSAILHHDPRAPRALNPRIPRDLETIVLKCLEKAPADRYGTAEALAQDLRRCARGDPIEARPQSTFEKAWRRVRRHRGKLAAAAAITCLGLAVLWFAAKSHRQAEEARLASYEAAVVDAAGRIQVGCFANQAGHMAWSGQGFNVERLTDGLDGKSYGEFIAPVVRALEDAIALYPERPEAHFHLGQLLLYHEDHAGAEKELKLAAARGSTPAMIVLARLLEQSDRSEEAAPWREKAAGSPAAVWAEAVVEGDEAAYDERWPAATEAYEKAIEIQKAGINTSPASAAEVFLSAGIAHIQVGNLEVARRRLEAAGALRPGALEPELLTGVAYRAEGNVARAEEIFERLYARAASAVNPKRNAASDVANWVTMMYWSRYRDSERALKWAERMAPSYEKELWKATCLATLRPGPEAVAAAARLPEMRPEAPLSWFVAATTYMSAGDFARAEAMAAEAAVRAPRSSMPHQLRAEALRQQGKLAETHAALLKSVEVEPDSALAHFYLGLSCAGQELYEPAEASFQRAIEIATRTNALYVPLGEAYLRLGQVRLARGRKEEAFPAFRQSVDAYRGSGMWEPEAYLAAAYALFEKNERREAIRVLEDGLDSPVANPVATAQLATRLEEYARAVLPDLPTYRAIDLAVARSDRADLLAAGAPWKFWKGSAAPSPGLEWTRPDFDDAKWEEGPSGFGYGDGDDATVLGDMRGNFTTLYLRARFRLPDPALAGLVLSVKCDDGFIAYLNGVEAARHHAPDAVVVPHDARASEQADEPLLPVDVALDPAHLDPRGENLLAIQGLNFGPESSDFSLIPILRGRQPREPGRVREVLAAFATAADPSRDAGKLAYLRGLALEAEAQSERAVEQFVIAASLDAERPEPAVALARALRAGGRSDEARARLEPHLARTGNRGLWDLWLAIALADLKLEPEEILKHMPQEDEARPAVEWMRGVRADLPGDLRWLFTRLAKREAVRIHCGGPGWTGPDGTSWSHDRFFTSGNTFGNGRYLFPGEIEGTDADPLYRGERYFPALEPGLAAYTFPLTRGRYRVTLHFAEIHFRAPGQRVFDVLIEGETVLEAFDPGAAGFATAVERPFEVAVEDGRLEIGFRKRINHPKVSAIEIVSLP